ncbi:AMP deaminase-like [Arachis hypogaea]|uniref:AMP deaminase-like n=1 Tax=Arachis hypogaea TaxID=3818 RepID=UPI0034E672FE
MLREIFLKQDNLIQGCFLGELTKQVFFDLVASKYQLPRLYNVYKEMGIVTSFQNMLNNIFIPPLRLLLILIHISASCFLKAGCRGLD